MQIEIDKIEVQTNNGENLKDVLKSEHVLLVFLRHFGCTFCRETLTDLEKLRYKIEYKGVKIVLVHMMKEDYANQIFSIYDLHDISHVADPKQDLYKLFKLNRGSLNQLFGVKVMLRAIWAGLFKGHMIGKLRGDGFQMPGVFIFNNGELKQSFIHKFSSDKPDYLKLTEFSASF